jgi:hypothetical protein
MLQEKVAARRAERPYTPTEARLLETIEEFMQQHYTWIRLPGVKTSRSRWMSERQRVLERDFKQFWSRVEGGASVSMGDHSHSPGAQVNGAKNHEQRALRPSSLHNARARGSAKRLLNRLAAQSGYSG